MILNRQRLKPIFKFLAWSGLFAALYAQSPLYLSNQNTYFLHGLAQAGLGDLRATDWLANTADPTPLFSALVYLTYRLTHSGFLFYVYYALLLGIYLYSLTGIMELLFGMKQKLIFTALVLGLHSAALRFGLGRIVDAEATFLLEGGLGNQRLLGQVFQPSAFGVLLILSIYLFLRQRDWRAIPPLAAAVSFHPTYLTGAALLGLGYLWMLWREGKSLRQVSLFGGLLLTGVLPITLYTFFTFGPTNPVVFAQAQQILVNVRVPHHALILEWFNWTSGVQLGLIAIGLFLTRKTSLFPLYAIGSAGAFLLSLLQLATGNNTLALLFPWRISVILVPLGTVSLAAAWSATLPSHRWLNRAAWVLIGLLAAAGLIRFQFEVARQRNQPERPLMAYVRAHRATGQVYVTPPKMQDFRLVTGAAVFADFKSNPYRDTDVLEWYRRVEGLNRFYNAAGGATCQDITDLLRFANTNQMIMPVAKLATGCDTLQLLYQDENYALLALEEEK